MYSVILLSVKNKNKNKNKLYFICFKITKKHKLKTAFTDMIMNEKK